MIELVFLLATGLAAPEIGPVDGAARTPSMLDQRLDAASSRRVLEDLIALRSAGETPDLALEAAILQARLWLGERHGTGDELYVENMRAGLRLLAPPGSPAPSSIAELEALLPVLPPEAATVLLWTALSHARTIQSEAWYAQPGAALRFVKLLERAAELDGSVFHGGPHRALADYRARAPGFMNGDDDQALADAREALEIAPDFAPNLLALVRVLIETGAPHAEITALLQRALEVSSDEPPGAMAEQRRAQHKAREFLEQGF